MLFRSSDEDDSPSANQESILTEKNLITGVIAQFFYVGAQVCVSSFFIRFVSQAANITEKPAAKLLSIALLAFMVGRFFGTFLMRFIAPSRLLALYSLLNIGLLAIAVTGHGQVPVYALIGVEFFMSIMFPTIFALSIRGLGSKTKLGSSLVIMAIAGGAFFPVIMGQVSDLTTMQTAYLVPACCFLPILYFAVKNFTVKNVTLTASH